ELAALRERLRALERVRAWLERSELEPLRRRVSELVTPAGLLDRLVASVPDDPPPTSDAPGLFRPGVSAELDASVGAEAEGMRALAALERREQESTGIRSLKVRYNQVFGYYLEVTRPHLAKVPASYRRKQTIAQGERFTSDELAAIEERIL